MKKILAIFLSCVIPLTLIAGCKSNGDNLNKVVGNDGASPMANVGESAFSNVYTETQLDIDVDGTGNQAFVISGDRIYYDTYNNLFTERQQVIVMTAKLDGSDTRDVWTQVEYDEENPDAPRPGLITFNCDEEGNLWVLTSVITPDENNPAITEEERFLQKIDIEGNVLVETNISNVDRNMYIQSSCFDSDGNFYVHSGQTVYGFEADTCRLAFTITESGYLSGLAKSNTGKAIYIMGAGQNGGYLVKTINFEAGAASTGEGFSTSKWFSSITTGFGDYLFTFTYTDNVYGVREDNMAEEVIVSFINSDIDPQTMGAVLPLDNGDFIARKVSNFVPLGYARLSENADASVGEKVIITLGTVYLDNNTKAAILDFNKNSTEARIEVVDYSTYNTATDFTKGTTQLDMDILAGNVPDILSVSGLDVTKYVAKGVLEDLNGYLDSDPNAKREDLFENVLKASETDGKLYHIIPFFTIQSIVGKTSIFGDRLAITPAELAAVTDKYPDADIMYGFSADNWLSMTSYIGLGSFIDWSTGECHFDTPEFVDYLEFTKRFPETVDMGDMMDPSYFDNYNTMFKEERTLLQYQQIASVRDVRSAVELFGEDISFIGFPTTADSGNVIAASADYAISATSQHKDIAWGFISRMLQDNEKVSSGGGSGMFQFSSAALSINKNWFENALKLEATPIEERDFSKGVELQTMWGPMTYNSLDDVVLSAFPEYELTEQEADQVRHVVSTSTLLSGGNQQIINIIQEEAGAFWAGAKTGEDAARVIQSRASIYVSENLKN